MEDLTYTELTAETLTARSLDGFVRRQVVEECWRRVDGALVLRPVAYVEDWTLAGRRTRAEEMLEGVRQGARFFAALDGEAVVGFAYLKPEPFGSRGQYRELGRFHVSEPCRGRGVGRRLPTPPGSPWPSTAAWAVWRRRSSTSAWWKRSPATCRWSFGCKARSAK